MNSFIKNAFSVLFALLLILQSCSNHSVTANNSEKPDAVYVVVNTDDFTVTGNGSNPNWQKAEWLPLTQHAVTVRGGEQKHQAEISGWTAEFFIPYNLLRPLQNIQPESGAKWRANFYRVDYDEDRSKSWSWQLTERNFHDFSRFGTLLFE